ncbi:helix-turn-helix domain-containing protein [Companilactobacillus musae]|uniref:helix-turn-helix transcriptional regulator n=1 Tax=Companilactobacillus musae TaxID=1903258 RepID=UPI000E655B9A|nr:helix-turn-helix domain-containing protein [Companilactobacillus musae]
MELCEQLKKYRKQNNLTQRDLALKLNVSDKTISSWETGRTYPDISLLINLSSILKVSLDEFLKGDTGTVEKIDKDLRLKKIYKRWLISVITIFVAIGGGFIFLSKYQYENETVDRFNPLLQTKVGYAALPTEENAKDSDYSKVLVDSKKKKYKKTLGSPYKHMVVTDDAWGKSLYLNFYGGLAPRDKGYAMVEHKGIYVSRINFVDWETIPKSIRNSMFKDYSKYRDMYEMEKNAPKMPAFKGYKEPKVFTVMTGTY